MGVHYVAKVYRQHTSLVLSLPKGVCNALLVDHGCLVSFDVQDGKELALFTVVMRKDGSRGGDTGHTDIEDRDGRSCPAV